MKRVVAHGGVLKKITLTTMLAVFWMTQVTLSARVASAQGPPSVWEANQRCEGGSLTVDFPWVADQDWDEAWVDLSLVDNGFLPGTFIGYPGPPRIGGFGTVSWQGIAQGQTHYWRVNLRYGANWYVSPTQTFQSRVCPSGPLPPGPGPSPGTELTIRQECTNYVRGTGSFTLIIAFEWRSNRKWDEAWVDLSRFDNGFAPGTFIGYGPLKPDDTFPNPFIPTQSTVYWEGIAHGYKHYWRVNLRYGGVWYTSATQTFFSATLCW